MRMNGSACTDVEGAASSLPKALVGSVQQLTGELFEKRRREIAASTDRMFAVLMFAQFVGAIIAACTLTPLTWIGKTAYLHQHVGVAVVTGGALAALVWYLARTCPGRHANAYAIAVAQSMMSVLLIHLTGGRIETHFHVFGSLAFLAQYRSVRVLMLGTVLVGMDHGLRNFLWPQSVFGLTQVEAWRWLEHAAWVVFEDIVLIFAIRTNQRESLADAQKGALLSINKQVIEQEVQTQTQQLAERKRQLEMSESRLRTVIDAAYDAYIRLDAQLRVVDWSRRAQELTGWSSEQVIDQYCADKLELSEMLEAIRLALAANAGQELREADGAKACLRLMETTCKTAGGQHIYVETSWSLAGENEEVTINIFLRDITERKHQAVQQMHSQKMESIGQLAAGIAHEINTPSQFVGDNLCFLEKAFKQVNEMMGWMNESLDENNATRKEMAEKVKLKLSSSSFKRISAEIPKALQQSREGMQRISSITRAMKEFSHPGAETMESIDLHAAIQTTLTVCRNEWKYVADVVTEFANDVSYVECVPGELNQVIINIVVNAAHAIGDIASTLPDGKGKIVVRTRSDAGKVLIEIEDNGPGIPEAIRNRIFDPFFTTKEVGKGTGQGLAIAHSVMERHHGSIHMNSTVGVGTKFQLVLPVRQAEVSRVVDVPLVSVPGAYVPAH